MIVMKFGGTSVEDAAAIRNVAEIVGREVSRKPVVVVSACAGITNQLLKTANLAAEGKRDEALQMVAAIEGRHKNIVKDLFEADAGRFLYKHIAAFAEELAALVNGVVILGELTPRTLDAFASYGERMSSFIIHHYFEAKKLRSFLVDARSFMLTDGQFTKALPLLDLVERKLQEIVRPKLENGYVVLTQGFIGSTQTGITTTIGRGGSDYSAAIVGSLLDAKDIQIWTDVDGILSSDPTVVKDAKKIKVMSFNEAAELAYFGARVLHPETILPAVKKDIPVHVLNSRRPDYAGTLIIAKPKVSKECIVKSIAYKEGITLVSIVSTRMFLAHGFLESVFDVFHKYETVVHTVATSEVSISVTIDNVKNLGPILQELKPFATVSVSDRKAIVCVVGDHLKESPGIAAKVLGSIPDINVNMISQGASEINISLVIDEEHVDDVVRRLHKEFFSDVSQLTEIFE
ncbi:MAG TPA: lysine-sensitive aspartokinase 3 [Bacteroidota bacterium]|nr:lysine-sensitive aspartokinase 3 [Bacteroidota bacterium]